jgi:YtkA-like
MTLSRAVALAVVLFAGFSCGGSQGSSSSDFPEAPYLSFTAEGRGLELELRTAPTQPPERGEVVAALTVRDRASRAPLDGLSIDVVPFMTAHGHGANAKPVITALGQGLYRIENLQLVMAGAWDLRFDLRGEGTDAHATATLDVH